MNLMVWITAMLLCSAVASAQSQPMSDTRSDTPLPPHRVKLAPDVASSLIDQKVPIKYPDAARQAGIQGTVALQVVIGTSGEVKQVTVISGDPALAKDTCDTVKQWKYRPYIVNGSAVEIEAELTINFHMDAKPSPAPPPLGDFSDDVYRNEYFDLHYPIPREWVRETQLVRSKVPDAPSKGTYILLAALYVPHNASLSQVDSSFILYAVARSRTAATTGCKPYLDTASDGIEAHKEGHRKGDVSQFTIDGREFYRQQFDLSAGIAHRALICTMSRDYYLLWNISGRSKESIETAARTLQSISGAGQTAPQLAASQVAQEQTNSDQSPPAHTVAAPMTVRIAQGVSAGLLIKKVAPDYPTEARSAHIQGQVILQAKINENGEIEDLEIVQGPPELAVSAVNAVRQWKYRPYLLAGKPVTVQTQIVVNYTLSR